MFKKRLLTAIALTTVISTVLAFSVPSDAQNGKKYSFSESEVNQTEETEEIIEDESGETGEGAEEDTIESLYGESMPAAGVAATMNEGTEYTELSGLVQSIIDEENPTEDEEEETEEVSEIESSCETAPEEVVDIIPEEKEIKTTENPSGMPSGDALAMLEARAEAELNKNAACIAGDYVHLREEASPLSNPVGVFYRNAGAEIIGEEGEWYLIHSGNITGYVRKSDCATGAEAVDIIAENTTTTATVEAENLALREAPDFNSAAVEILPKEEELNVVWKFGDWAYVETEDGETGFIFAPYASMVSTEPTALSNNELDEQAKEAIRKEQEEKALQSVVYRASNGLPTHYVSQTEGSEKGRELIEFAVQFVGNPYVMGGTSLTDGCDCSGFVMSVYEEFGFHLTHSTEIDQQEGIAVESIETAEPGDIICYQGHVALYMGDGLIVHAAGEAKGIRIAPACYTDIITIRRMFVED